MSPSRLEAFSDGVMAVIITIMVLELRPPSGTTLYDLKPLVPKLLIYALSFLFIGIYWNNHHHLIRATKRITSGMMWANLHLLFWLSLMPFITSWVGEYPKAMLPAALYGFLSMLAGTAFYILTKTVAETSQSDGEVTAQTTNQKAKISVLCYIFGVILALVSPILSYGVYAFVAVMWVIPDERLARRGDRAF